jgi:peptidoglycan L-alanyl-D-glutamate endopeptidase CwlK
MNKWSERSKKRLNQCHPDLIKIANTVLSIHDCTVIEGHRGEKRQNEYYKNGTSKVKFPNGKHNKKPSMAIDLAPYKYGMDYYDMENVLYFAGIVMAVAEMLHARGDTEHELRWGGTWSTRADHPFVFDNPKRSFFDGIHFELV